MSLVYKEYTLDEFSVEGISAQLQDYLAGQKMDTRDIQRIRLTIEELLLNIMDHAGESVKISVGIGKQFGRHLIRMRYEMDPFDPVKESENPWADDMMRSLGFAPSWSCRRRANTVSLILADRPRRSTLFYLVLAVIAAVGVGLLARGADAAALQAVDEAFLTPVEDSFLGLLRSFSGLMIVLTICSGIIGMGDTTTLGSVGKNAILRFIGLSFLVSAVSAAIVLPFLSLAFTHAAQGSASVLVPVSKLFFGMVPKNIIEPFQTGNALQLIVIAAIIGGVLLVIGERGSQLRVLITQGADLMQQVVATVCSLIPLFVFAVLLRQIWSGKISAFLSVYKPLLLALGTMLVVTGAILLYVSFRLNYSPRKLFRKVLPVFLVAFTTASSMTAMPLGMETCEKRLGVRKSVVSFLYPLGSVIFMPSSVVYFTVMTCSFAEIYHIEVSVSWLLMAVIVSTLVVIALPPIPGADILGYSILFSSLGIPGEALVLATGIDILMDFFDTGFNVLLLQLQIASEAARCQCLDRQILEAE